MAAMFTEASVQQTRAALAKAVRAIESAAPRAERNGAAVVAAEMKARAPVDTGHLRTSIRVEEIQGDRGYALRAVRQLGDEEHGSATIRKRRGRGIPSGDRVRDDRRLPGGTRG